MRILFLIVLLDTAAFAVLLPAIIYVLTNWGASPAFATFIIATYSIGKFLVAPFWGALSDRFGRKPIMAISLSGDIISYIILIFAKSAEAALISRIIAGLMAGNIATFNASVSDMTNHENRAKGLGIVGAAIGLGYVFGPAIGGALGGISAEKANLVSPAIASLILSAFSMLTLVLFFKETLVKTKDRIKLPSPGRLKLIGYMARRKFFALFFLMVFCVSATTALIGPVTPLLVDIRYNWGPRQMGMVFVAVGLSIALVQGALVGRLTKAFGEAELVRIAAIVIIAGLLLIVYSPISSALVIGYCLAGAGATLFNTAINAIASRRAAKNEQGMVMGAMQSMHSLGRAIGPVFAGSLFMIWLGLPYISGVMLIALCFVLISWLIKTGIK